jgi:hypothetical protein
VFGYTESGTRPFPAGARNRTASGKELAVRCAEHPGVLETGPAAQLALDADPVELNRRLTQAEAALARTRARRAVRFADAARRVQQGRTWADLRAASAILRHDGRS